DRRWRARDRRVRRSRPGPRVPPVPAWGRVQELGGREARTGRSSWNRSTEDSRAVPGRGHEVLCQEARRVGDAAVAGQAADIDDVKTAFTFDHVDTVQLEAERRPARQRDPAQLGA